MTPKPDQQNTVESGEERGEEIVDELTEEAMLRECNGVSEDVPTPNKSNSKKQNTQHCTVKVPSAPAPVPTPNDGNSSKSSGSSSRNTSKMGGYTADCSSISNCSDSSSETSNGVNNGSPTGGNNLSLVSSIVEKAREGDVKTSKSPFQSKKKKKCQKIDHQPSGKPIAPIWQGVRVVNPMDPRIDLSSVEVIPASKLYNDPKDPTSSTKMNMDTTYTDIHEKESREFPSQDMQYNLLHQYSDLMNTLGTDSSIQALQDSAMNLTAAHEDEGSESSMIVLARVKRKYQKDIIANQEMKQQDLKHEKGEIIAQMSDPPLRNTSPKSNSVDMNSNDSNEALSSSLSSRSSSKKDMHQVHGLLVNKNVHLMKSRESNQAVVTDSLELSGGTGSDQARTTETNADGRPIIDTENAEAATLERIALKKRKRLDKRREYEEEVRRQLQESSDSDSEKVFKIGEIVTMEEALLFANSARLIVQAQSPFLAVHVNAAFSRLTGMHNSGIIGRPLSKILSLTGNDEWSSSSKSLSSPSGEESPEENLEHLNSLSIERLMTGSKFESCYKVTTIVDKGDDKSSEKSNSVNEDSNNSSITSKEDSFTPMKCTMSICRIVSTQTRGRNSSTFRIHESPSQKQKKTGTKDNMKTTHCLIQLSPHEESCGSMEDKGAPNEKVSSTEENSSSSPAQTCG